MRASHIGAEANITSLGLLNLIGGLGGLFTATTTLIALAGIKASRGRVLQTVTAIIGIGAGATVGTAVISSLFWGGLVLVSIWSRKARMVFSGHYRSMVIPATPHIKPVTRIWLWLLLVLLVAVGAAVWEAAQHR